MIKAYSYIRFSSARQMRGDSLRRQIELSEQYAKEHGLELDQNSNLRDLGLSAFDGSNVERGALGAFLAAIEAGQIPQGSYLLVESLDRLSREQLIDALTMFLNIIRRGIVIVTLADRMVYEHKSMGENFAPLLISITIMARAHEESLTKSRRTRAAWSNKIKNAKDKKLTARCPAWMRISADSKRFDLIPERAEIVKEIIRLSQSGLGQWSISHRINARGEPNWSGKPVGWHVSYISKILNSPALYGEFQPQMSVDGKLQPHGDPIPDYFPALITRDEFLALRSKRKLREFAKARKGNNVPNLLSGLVKCGYCGSTMSLVSTKLKKTVDANGTVISQTHQKALICEKGRRGLSCYAPRWDYHDFELSFLSLCTGLEISTLIHESSDEKASNQGLQDELQLVEAKLTDCGMRLQNLVASVELGQVPKAMLSRMADLENEIQSLSNQQKVLTTQIVNAQVDKHDQTKHVESLQTLLDHLANKEGEDLFELRAALADHIRRFVDKVYLFPSGSITSEESKQRLSDTLKNSNLSDDEINTYLRSLRMGPERSGKTGRYAYNKTIDRHFLVHLRSGLATPVFPDFDDPTKLGPLSLHASTRSESLAR